MRGVRHGVWRTAPPLLDNCGLSPPAGAPSLGGRGAATARVARSSSRHKQRWKQSLRCIRRIHGLNGDRHDARHA